MTEEQTKPENPMEDLFGPSLMKGVNSPKKQTTTALLGKDLVLLYFSASWCTPCKAFSPLLVKFYNNCAKEGKMEVVFVSSDRTIESFNDYYQTMPWLAISAEAGGAKIKANLAQALSVTGIPALFVLDVKTGNMISSNARNEVSAVGDDKNKGRELIASWKQKETIPLDVVRAAPQDKGIMGILTNVLFTILKNPIYILGSLYFFKSVKNYLKEKGWIPHGSAADEL